MPYLTGLISMPLKEMGILSCAILGFRNLGDVENNDERHKLKSALRYVGKNGCKWDSNPCLHQPDTYSGIEVAAILKHKTALTTQALQLYADSSMLTYYEC